MRIPRVFEKSFCHLHHPLCTSIALGEMGTAGGVFEAKFLRCKLWSVVTNCSGMPYLAKRLESRNNTRSGSNWQSKYRESSHWWQGKFRLEWKDLFQSFARGSLGVQWALGAPYCDCILLHMLGRIVLVTILISWLSIGIFRFLGAPDGVWLRPLVAWSGDHNPISIEQ